MAWENTLLEASYRDVVFDILRADDSAERAHAEHAYPYRDGADVEDLGRGARRISIEAIFYGAEYEEALQDFIKALEEPSAGVLRHPIFADMTVQPVRFTVRHEADAVDQCSVSVEFIESTPGHPFFDRGLPVQDAEAVGSAGEVARGALASGLSDLVGKLRAANPLAVVNELRAAITQPLLALVGEVQGVVMSGLDLLAAPRAFCNDLSLLVDGVLDIKDFVSGSLLSDFNAIKGVLGLLDVFGFGRDSEEPGDAESPIFLNGVPTEAQAIAAVEAQVSAQQAIGEANACGLVLAAEAETPTLSPPEIETVANTARASLEAAIVAIRATFPLEAGRPQVEALKNQAKALLDAARAVIETRPPLLDRQAPVTGNLRLQAHAWYGDHTRAPELCRLNPGLRLPNFVAQGETLHAFSR